jgi:hypothetical protein
MLGDDDAGASTLEVSQLQRIGSDEWVRSVDEDSTLPIGERVERIWYCGPGHRKQHEVCGGGFSHRGRLGADASGNGRQGLRAASTGKLHAVACADQPAPHRQADMPCTEDSDLHCFS